MKAYWFDGEVTEPPFWLTALGVCVLIASAMF